MDAVKARIYSSLSICCQIIKWRKTATIEAGGSSLLNFRLEEELERSEDNTWAVSFSLPRSKRFYEIDTENM